MATQQFDSFRAARAAADLSARRNRAVARDAAGLINVAGAGAAADGILIDGPKPGLVGTFQVRDQATWETGAAFAAGVWLTPDAQGRAVVAVAGNYRLARSNEPSAGAGQVIAVEIVHAGNA